MELPNSKNCCWVSLIKNAEISNDKRKKKSLVVVLKLCVGSEERLVTGTIFSD